MVKHKFDQHRRPILINNIDINKIEVSDEISIDKKSFNHFTGYQDRKKLIPLCILHPKMNTYRRYFDETKCMFFLIKDNNC